MDGENSGDAQWVAQSFAALRSAIGTVIIGQDEAVRLSFVTLLCSGHSLYEGVPGVAKTLLVRTLAAAIGVRFGRIQCTPDLMPSDIIGTPVLHGDGEFRFRPGPLFTDLLLVDEINRAPAKTQAALLEAMQERAATVDGTRYSLGDWFTVLATQNPIEQEGTYPLPEAQLDRFMFLVDVGYPTAQEEIEIVKNTTGSRQVALKKVLSPEKIMALQDLVRRVPVPDHVVQFAVALVRSTRPKEPNVPEFIQKSVAWGAGPRASQYLVIAAKARAVLNGRYIASVEDVRALARPILCHRVLPSFHAESEGITSTKLVDQLLALVKL